MRGFSQWRLALLSLALAQALMLQAVLPSWSHLLRAGFGAADGFPILCRFQAPQKTTDQGQQPRPLHDCLASCLAALTGSAVSALAPDAMAPSRRFVIVSPSHRALELKREHLSTAWFARGPPSVA